jgi:hypothetical protein
MVQQNQIVSFTANAVDKESRTMYYRFDLIPNYGESSYDPDHNYSTIQDFSTTATASYAFDTTGNYIVVNWASPTQGFSSGYNQIMGGSVHVVNGSDTVACIQITGLDFSTGQQAKTGDLVTLTAEAVNNCSSTTYYRFDLIPNYGESSYDPNNNYTVIQDFSTDASCSYKFTTAGNYIVVVWASTTPSLPSGTAPIFGGSIQVTD